MTHLLVFDGEAPVFGDTVAGAEPAAARVGLEVLGGDPGVLDERSARQGYRGCGEREAALRRRLRRAQLELDGQLPASTPITPPLGACCAAGSKCRASADLWTSPAWKALRFAMDEDHDFSYAFTAEGKAFRATADGDLNCNGLYSTYEMKGTIEADGTVTSSPLARTNELE